MYTYCIIIVCIIMVLLAYIDPCGPKEIFVQLIATLFIREKRDKHYLHCTNIFT